LSYIQHVRLGILILLLVAPTSCSPGIVDTSTQSISAFPPTNIAAIAPSLIPTQVAKTTATTTSLQKEPLPAFTIEIQKTDEFEPEDTILVSVSPGIAQWYDISYIDIKGDEQLNCITCDVVVSYNTGIDDEAKFWSPSWSPDGTSCVFGMLSETPDYLSVDGIVHKKVGFPDEVLISGENAWYNNLTWSPDGDYVAYSRNNNINKMVAVCFIDVFSASPNEKCSPVIDENKVNSKPAWSPDGKSILFSSAGDKYHFYLWNIEDQRVTQFTDISGDDLLGKWSPDGSKFAYIIGTRVSESGFVPYQYDLYISDADGFNGQIVPNTGATYDFDWSPDGKKIVFTQRSPIENDPCDVGCLPFTVLKIMDLETGDVTSLTDGTEWIGDPAWRP
jgi:Tol biopolymer transport system component